MSIPKVAIIGAGLAGLAGLYAAYRLHQRGIQFEIFEARSRVGGRILSTNEGGFDLGSSCYWPETQSNMESLLSELQLKSIEQYATGVGLHERWVGNIVRQESCASSNAAMRIQGGSFSLIKALTDLLPENKIHLGVELKSAQGGIGGVSLTLSLGGGRFVEKQCSQLWLALPPQLANKIHFVPELKIEEREKLASVPTCMAGHAKYVARYEFPFWRNDGLSGDAYSTIGPLGEVHDASHQQGEAALFGFLGIGPHVRHMTDELTLKSLCRDQLVRLFGEKAARLVDDSIHDWSADPLTATEADQFPPTWYGAYDVPQIFEADWRERLVLVGSEAAGDQGGYMEGALLAVNAALN
ncbi:amine oxidase [Pseudomonas atacamensis]|uniref:Amine oxidase n=1 Tax=Pseudomonas atacamensis TaxID=2565368 RepID=A0AAQ2D6X1_9PSED|nr:FAD-dependent oxidoreductase [Pseudomonas atacamensis]THF25785.1 amine oxidase [Pseudomonas atacamensis]